MPSPLISDAVDRLLAGEDIGRQGAADVLDVILSGEAGEAQTAAFLIALRAKGETAEEIAGLASVIRRRARRVEAPAGPFIDTCGTGGGASSFNVSTAAAFVAAGAGVAVAKHGNRSATSRSGSADVLEALGARIDLDPDGVSRCLQETGVGFMFAPAHHPAFAHVVPVRRALGVRTVFNMIGPLTNPAGAPRQLLGVSDAHALERIATALAALGTERALVVRGRDGLDEVSTAATTDVFEVVDGGVRRTEIDPAALDVAPAGEADIAGGSPDENAEVVRRIVGGGTGPAADLVALNAGAALWVAGVARDLADGLTRARESIASGAAGQRLDAFVDATHRFATPTAERR
ncbi:MAG TPA: anthranilate phosphoribosyltransferase [Miltoncostaeaceae bacterium]|nr:anthranilate phosphoribosyltransferase [Miltoncostaeaceae bacterium]